MSEFTFSESGETYKIKGPEGMTQEQAQAIFKQQFSTGSLAGFKPGDALSAATQAAGGLASAQAMLKQSLGSLSGSLPLGVNLGTITAGLGTNGSAAFGQVQSALSGQIPQLASLTTGSSAAINGAISGITSQIPSAIAGLKSTASVAIGALTGQSAQAGSIANNAIATLTGTVGGVPLQGIDTANFVKQLPALGSIGNLGQADVTGTLAQASKMVGQSFNTITNSLGAGKFGLDATQLERAGMIKPGTAAAFLQSGEQDLVSVLQSPTVWTGQGGVKSLDGLLNNPGLQDKVQQGLMSAGLNDLKQFGVPVNNLTPQALSGLATNAAKSPTAALEWVKGAALPAIPTIPGGDVKSAFDAMSANGAFAVKFATDKIEPPLKLEEPVTPAVDTVNSKTVDAAATRVVGNEKVPSVIPDGTVSAAKSAVTTWLDFSISQSESFDTLEQQVISLTAKPGTITQQQWNTANEEYQLIKATYNSRVNDLQTNATQAINAVPEGDNRANLVAAGQSAQKYAILLRDQAIRIKKLLNDLANKIAT